MLTNNRDITNQLALPLESAGKLKQLLVGVGEILATANVSLTEEDIAPLSRLIENSAMGGEVEASCLTDEIEVSNWFAQIDRAISIFSGQFKTVFQKSSKRFKEDHQGMSREAIAQDMVKDIANVLSQYVRSYPSEAIEKMRGEFISEPYLYPSIFASRQTENNSTTINSSRRKDKDITILGTADVEIGAHENEIEASANQTPCSGVLFLIDEPSESSPSKGSDYPLYVPREIAERCVEAIAQKPGLPLDIDESLTQHSKSSITGIINSAEIQGNKFIVHGHLFPWSQTSKVALIAANKRNLGMSMNAHASGQPGVVNGQKVFLIDHLELLGANILKASHATYQKTRFWANEIAASAATSTSSSKPVNDFLSQGESMGIEEQLDKLTQTLNTIVESAQKDSKRVGHLEEMMDSRFKILEELEASRQRELEASYQREVEAAKKQEKQELLEAVQTMIEASQKNLIKAINPSGSPSRLAPLIQASGSDDEDQAPPLNNIERRLLQVRGRLIEARTNKEPGYVRAKLIEEQTALETQLHNNAVVL